MTTLVASDNSICCAMSAAFRGIHPEEQPDHYITDLLHDGRFAARYEGGQYTGDFVLWAIGQSGTHICMAGDEVSEYLDGPDYAHWPRRFLIRRGKDDVFYVWQIS